MTCHLGLDFGTSGARGCVVDADGFVIHEDRFAYPDPGEQSPLDWREALLLLLRRLPAEIAGQLTAIAVDGTSATVLLCDTELKPVSPVLLYSDAHAVREAGELTTLAPAGHIACNATSGLAKFKWMTKQAGVDHAAWFMHQADWLTSLLSGQPGISDYHNALKTGYDVERLCWPEWVMALPYAHLLPDVKVPGTVIGTIRSDIAAHLGINPQCLIHAGTTDSTAAFIASGIGETGIGLTSLGTTLVLKQLSDRRIEAPEYGIYSHRFGDLWLVGGASNAGAGVLQNYFSNEQLSAMSAQIDPQQDSPLDYYPLNKTGERFPVCNPELSPRLEPRPASNVEFLHGLLQGLCRIEAAGYAKLAELGAPALKHIISSGGGAENDIWRRMRERILAVPVTRAVHGEAAYGTALLCSNPAQLRNTPES